MARILGAEQCTGGDKERQRLLLLSPDKTCSLGISGSQGAMPGSLVNARTAVLPSFKHLIALQMIFLGLGLSRGSDSTPHAEPHWVLSLVQPQFPLQTFPSVFP